MRDTRRPFERNLFACMRKACFHTSSALQGLVNYRVTSGKTVVDEDKDV
jgi:hypothetical protein